MAQKLKTSLKIFKYSLLIVAITVCFIGCSKDEETKTPNPLRGEWNFKGKNSYNDIVDITWIFNSNWTFTWIEESSAYTQIDTIKGKYSIYEKDKNNIILTITSSNNAEIPTGEHGIVRFAKYNDHIGEYLVFNNENNEKYYRKK